MKFNKKMIASGVLAASLMAAPAWAKVPAAEVAKLGTSLTPSGAEKAGNGGDIPAWDGGLKKSQIPAGYTVGGEYLDPFADETPKFVIDQSNLDKYKDKLSLGQIAMIKKYADYKMPVYPTHRTAAFPQFVLDAIKRNAAKTELVSDGNGLNNFDVAIPFPIPQNALEVIWNQTMRWRGGAVERSIGQATPLANGQYTVVRFHDEIMWRTSVTDFDPKVDDNVLFYFKQEIVSPSRLAGNVLLVHETIDQVAEPRRAWVYNAGQRRVRRAPQVAYDGPGTASDGLRTADNFDLYNGAPDRYTWKLLGKKEMYIPYNSYKVASKKYKYDDVVKAGHLNQDLTRYELHRVWAVEATLKPGERHVYAKRTFYLDEDSWQAGVIDHYDGNGVLWRVAEAHALQFYDALVPWYAVEVLYDLLSSRYLVLGLMNEEEKPYNFGIKRKLEDYTPAALRRSGVR